MMENGVQKVDNSVSEEEIKAADSSVLGENAFQVLQETNDTKEGDDGIRPRTLSEDETITVDGAISKVSLMENVVQVFHESGEGEEVVKPVLEEETKTVDGAAAKLKLGENIVQVFHEAKDSEGDVFEEAMMDVDPEEVNTTMQEDQEKEAVANGDVEKVGDEDGLEVNGSGNDVNDVERFEEAVEIDLLSSEVEERVVIEEKLEDLVDEKPVDEGDKSVEEMLNFESLEVNGGGSEDVEADKFEETVDRNVHVEQPIVVEEPLEPLLNADFVKEVKVTDAVGDNANEVLKGVVGEVDSDEKSSVIVDAEKSVSSNRDVESSGICDSAVIDMAVNGNLYKFEVEEEPCVASKSLDVNKVSPDETELPEVLETKEKILYQEEQIQNRSDATGVETFVDKDMDTSDIKAFSRDLATASVEGTEARQKETLSFVGHHYASRGERVRDEAIEFEAENSQVHHPSDNIEGVGDHATVRQPEVEEMRNDIKKQNSLSAEVLVNSASARETEIQPPVEPAQPPRPAGLGGAAPLLDPSPRVVQHSRVNGAVPQRQAQLVEDPMNGEAEENDETREKLQMIRVKFLRLAHRLGQTPHNVVVAQVLYRLGLAEQLRGRNASRSGAFSFDRASAMAEQIENAGQEPLDFSCTIMVLGKTGVGKSATINSIFDEVKFSTNAFQMGTKKVQDVVGMVQGIKVRVIDTPGLLPCSSDQKKNEKILHSVKRFIKKNPPDIVLYLDRLDMQSRDFGDLPLLRTITEIFGPSIWFNAIVVLTHAASAPPDGPNGISSSYEMFVTQRSHVVQQAIRQAAGDMRLMNPVSLVENHSACRTNRAGQRVLPNGQVWKPHLLLLSFASKILAEANTLLKLQDSPPGKPFATRSRAPPLPFLLSSLLQSRPQLKLPEEQTGDEDDLDEDLDESSDSDGESEYDELPPFKRLTKSQLEKLSKAQKNAYFDELEYREKLFMKKQLREERKRRRLLKKIAASVKELPNDYNENAEEEGGGAASVPVAMPDFTLPASFDSDNPTHRYRFLDTTNPWLVRPVLETHGWDHDVGYEGINVERLYAVKNKIPVSFSGQVTKDKKESNLQMELASSIKHNEGKVTSVGIDMQTVGKDLAYTLRSETRFSNFRHNKAAAGVSFTLLGDALTAGLKVEDRLIVNKRFRVVLTGGAMTGRGDVAYGGSLEATLRDKDYPLGRALSTLGLSVMDWHGDLAIGCNVQSQIPIGRSTNLIARANLNHRGSGQVSLRLNSSEQLQIALIGLLPIFKRIYGHYQQALYGE